MLSIRGRPIAPVYSLEPKVLPVSTPVWGTIVGTRRDTAVGRIQQIREGEFVPPAAGCGFAWFGFLRSICFRWIARSHIGRVVRMGPGETECGTENYSCFPTGRSRRNTTAPIGSAP